MTYAEKLKDPRWQKKRLEILNRDNFTCTECGDDETELHIHHWLYEYGKDPYDYDESVLSTLCKWCHAVVECNKKKGIETSSVRSLVNFNGSKVFCSKGVIEGKFVYMVHCIMDGELVDHGGVEQKTLDLLNRLP